MKNFKHRKKEIEFWSETGEVLGSDKHSETHVSSSGGGGHLHNGSGYISSPSVNSTTITNHEFWIKKEDGTEKDIKLRGVDIPLRPGQKVTIVSAGHVNKDKGVYSILVNHSANKHWFINNAIGLNKHLNIDGISGKSLLIGGALWWATTYVTDSIQAGATVAGIFVLYRLVTKLIRVFRLNKTLESHLNTIAQETYQTT